MHESWFRITKLFRKIRNLNNDKLYFEFELNTYVDAELHCYNFASISTSTNGNVNFHLSFPRNFYFLCFHEFFTHGTGDESKQSTEFSSFRAPRTNKIHRAYSYTSTQLIVTSVLWYIKCPNFIRYNLFPNVKKLVELLIILINILTGKIIWADIWRL